MPQTKLLYPYEYSSQIRLVARDPYDPAEEGRVFKWATVEEESSEEVSTLDLSHEDRPWARICFKVEASMPEEELAELVPLGADVSSDLHMYLSIICPATRLREAVELVRDDNVWRGDITIRHSHVRGTVQLTPFLVRATDLPAGTAPTSGLMLATDHAMRVGEGRRLALVVDPPNRSLKGLVKTVWERFGESSDATRRSNDSLPFDLDLGGEEPVLFLNSSQTGMRAALHSRARTGAAAVMRHTVNAAIAQSVWLQLFLAAVAGLDCSEGSEEIGLPSQQWKRRVLDTLVAQLPSNLPRDERIRSLVQMRDDQMETLVPRLAFVAQRVVRMGRLIRDAERAAERFLDLQEGSA
ncbi:MAG: hypothetical protein HOP28_08330 [Gemmatimonadales bacterium]|nr:hypothetical protein [Gemmatimonadales bacterium]